MACEVDTGVWFPTDGLVRRGTPPRYHMGQLQPARLDTLCPDTPTSRYPSIQIPLLPDTPPFKYLSFQITLLSDTPF